MTLTANQLHNVTDPEKLVNRMLSTESNQRPTASDVLKDPFFNSSAAESNFAAPQSHESQGQLVLKLFFIFYNYKQEIMP